MEDSFTEKLQSRRKATAAYISSKKGGTPLKSGLKRAALVEEQQISNTDFTEVPDESPKRQCIEHPPKTSLDSGKENVLIKEDDQEDQFIPFKASSNKGLAALRKRINITDGDKESETTGNTDPQPEESEETSSPVKKVSKVNEKDSVKSVSRDLFPKHVSVNTNPVKERVQASQTENGTSSKSNVLDRSLDPAELPLSARKALFEKSLFGAGSTRGGNQSQEQPKLSIAQRAAMFEKAAAQANYNPPAMRPIATKKVQSQPSPIKNIGMSPMKESPAKSVPSVLASPAKSAQAWASPVKSVPVQASPVKSALVQDTSPFKSAMVQEDVKGFSPVKKESSPLKVGSHVRLVQQQLSEQQRTVTWQDEQRKKEVEELATRHQRRQQSSASSHASSEEQEHQSSLMHKESEMPEYFEECGSEMESVYTERESESEYDGNMQEEESYEEEYPPSNAEDDPEVFNREDEEMSDYVEPEENPVQSIERNHRHVEYSNPDSEASFRSSSVSISSSYVSKSPSCSSLSSTGSGGEVKVETPLQHTVSFYRRQKQATRTPPLRSIVRRERVPSASDAKEQARAIQDQIKALQEEIQRQQVVIGQTSQALNLCHATAEFCGSTEQVEGERLLLIATQKRQACLNEIQRLKTAGAQNASMTDGMGTLTITDIQLPLKREFIAAQLEGKLNDAVHCFLCLIRYGPQVIITQMMSTSDKISEGSLCFTNHIKLQSLPPDFSVVFEVYALQTKKEHLPHDKKYHIRRDQSKMRLTPKGKKTESKLILPTIQSPGGPNTVRSSSFGVVGYTRFIIQNCHKKSFTLDKVPFASPLEGVLKVKLQLHAEHKVTEKGFLTMFEVVTGFGAWHRRWCYLKDQCLAYWKYPYDEQKKEPIGMIDLKKCVTGEVKLVPRDVCARPNTFELVTVRPRQKEDKESDQAGPHVITKHLLSADTKDERTLWCNRLNEALTNVRKWDSQALKPVEMEESAFVYPSSK